MSRNVEIVLNVSLDEVKVTKSIFLINFQTIFIERDGFLLSGRNQSVSL